MDEDELIAEYFGHKREHDEEIGEFHLKRINTAYEGNVEAQIDVAFAYQTGEWYSKDISKAVVWYTRSAKSGCAYAQRNLIEIYLRDFDVPNKYFMAYAWANILAMSGDPDGDRLCFSIKEELTKLEISRANKFSIKWKKAIAKKSKNGCSCKASCDDSNKCCQF